MLCFQCESEQPPQSLQEFLRDLPVMLPGTLIFYWAIVSVIVFAYHRMLPYFESLPRRRMMRERMPEQ